LLQRKLDDLSEAELQALCTDSTPESQTLDFKQALPGTSPEDKLELMKDVCALANADGGDIVYGIAEAKGAAGKLMPLASETPDAAKRRVTQVLDGIEPRIQGVVVHPVLVSGGCVLVVRVPASFDGPHSSRSNNLRRFVRRNGTSTTDMSIDQIRSAFDRTATLAEKAGHFLNFRIQNIEMRLSTPPFAPGPVCAAVLVPLAGMAGRVAVDIAAINDSYNRFMFTDWSSVNRTMNLDGLAIYPNLANGRFIAITQVYRNGAIESLRTGAGAVAELRDGEKLIPSTTIAKFFRTAVQKQIAACPDLGVFGPAVLRCALMHTTDYKLGVGNDIWGRGVADTDRPHLVLPDIWVNDVSEIRAERDLDDLVRPAMDILWQAFDVDRCLEFDLAGNWMPR